MAFLFLQQLQRINDVRGNIITITLPYGIVLLPFRDVFEFIRIKNQFLRQLVIVLVQANQPGASFIQRVSQVLYDFMPY